MIVPFKTKMMPEEWYQKLDIGIRFAVRVLHAHGFETCQSCHGRQGPKREDGSEHPYDRPTVDLVAASDDSRGFGALDALASYGLPVRDISLVWNIRNGLPYEKLWRITFWETVEIRADETPTFIFGYQAQ